MNDLCLCHFFAYVCSTDDSTLSFEEVATVNTRAIMSVLGRDPAEILFREDKLLLASTGFHAPDKLQVDIDGVVIATKKFGDLNIQVPFISLNSLFGRTKNLTKTDYHGNIFWEKNISQFGQFKLSLASSDSSILQHFPKIVENVLHSSAPEERKRTTIRRQDLSSGYLKINSQDVNFIYEKLDFACTILKEKYPDTLLRVVLYAFGQKDTNTEFNLNHLVKDAEAVYIHLGMDVLTNDDAHTPLWSRFGCEGVIGNAGDLYPSLSLSACANFALHSEDVTRHIHEDLAKVVLSSAMPGVKILFMTLYNSSPILRPREYHPISAMLASAGSFHHKVLFE